VRKRRGVSVLVVGAAGMLGARLAGRLARDRTLAGRSVERLCLADAVAPAAPAGLAGELEQVVVDLSEPEAAERLVADRPDVIFHLAAIVSGEAEADFDRGYRVNLDGTRLLLEAIRRHRQPYRPRLVFSSSIAVYGPPSTDAIPDDRERVPATSYGTQKAIAELLLADYTRRGFVDGVGIRLPTICVRPGAPNRAVSGFFSSIIREPLNGEEAVLPVPETVRHWFASPRAATDFLLHAAQLDQAALEGRPCLTMPGVSATVAEQLEALRNAAGDGVLELIRREPDDGVLRVVSGWPRSFDAARAEALGFRAEQTFDEIVRVHIEDELGGRVGAAEP
jgi:nucleoside-diphosphate-sugar epimerase